MEPGWTKNIPNSTICNFFYVFYVVYAILFVISLLFTISLFTYYKKMGIAVGLSVGLSALFTTAIVGVMTMFLYLICDRALIEKFLDEGFGIAIPNLNSIVSQTIGLQPTSKLSNTGLLATLCPASLQTTNDTTLVDTCKFALAISMCPDKVVPACTRCLLTQGVPKCPAGVTNTFTGANFSGNATCAAAVNACIISGTVPATISLPALPAATVTSTVAGKSVTNNYPAVIASSAPITASYKQACHTAMNNIRAAITAKKVVGYNLTCGPTSC